MEKVQQKLEEIVRDFFPNFPPEVIEDLSFLLNGNAEHVFEKLKKNGDHVVVVNHEERVVCLGSGFDWLHLPNFALIVNPFDPDFETPFATQLRVIRSNLSEKRIPVEEGVIVMISVSYKSLKDKRHSILKAICLLDAAQAIINEQFSDLIDLGLQVMVGIMDEETRLFEPINEEKLELFSQSNYVTPKELNKVGKFVIEHNRTQSEEYTSPYAVEQRKKYRSIFRILLIVLKCMDGRIHLPIATGIPMGIIVPMRNIGAKFHFGWKAFYDRVVGLIDEAIENRKNSLIFATYHFSNLNQHLGCAGHGYDTCAAMNNAAFLVKQAEFTFGKGKNHNICIAKIGFNTDINAIIVHGDRPDQVLDMEQFVRENFKI